METELTPSSIGAPPHRNATPLAAAAFRPRRPFRRALADLFEELSILGQFAFGREYGVGSSR